jgi:spermidine/putrescine ABC transporter ATP-binding subunit
MRLPQDTEWGCDFETALASISRVQHLMSSATNQFDRGFRVRLDGVSKSFGSAKAVDNISLDVPAGAFVSLLGPSGSGKTTTLNLIAGFLIPDIGEIFFDEKPVSNVAPNKRNIGMVFQSYALFPHMTVAENITFPLRMRFKSSRAEIADRVAEMTALMQLSGLEERYPPQLSGGQQQRVAMARALVSRPKLLLMDEPLGALDKKLREKMQVEIKNIHDTVGTTFVYVTHDQQEALTMSDLIVVMSNARIEQIGTPVELYQSPRNVFVADFLGDSNLIPVQIVEASKGFVRGRTGSGEIIAAATTATCEPSVGERATFLVRPEHIVLSSKESGTESEGICGVLSDVSYNGDSHKLSVEIGGEVLRLKVPASAPLDIQRGQTLRVSWASKAAKVLPPA